jgi:hypothetical protein
VHPGNRGTQTANFTLGTKTLVVSALDNCVEWINSHCWQLVAAANSLDNRFGIYCHCRLVAAVSIYCSKSLYRESELIYTKNKQPTTEK